MTLGPQVLPKAVCLSRLLLLCSSSALLWGCVGQGEAPPRQSSFPTCCAVGQQQEPGEAMLHVWGLLIRVIRGLERRNDRLQTPFLRAASPCLCLTAFLPPVLPLLLCSSGAADSAAPCGNLLLRQPLPLHPARRAGCALQSEPGASPAAAGQSRSGVGRLRSSRSLLFAALHRAGCANIPAGAQGQRRGLSTDRQ